MISKLTKVQTRSRPATRHYSAGVSNGGSVRHIQMQNQPQRKALHNNTRVTSCPSLNNFLVPKRNLANPTFPTTGATSPSKVLTCTAFSISKKPLAGSQTRFHTNFSSTTKINNNNYNIHQKPVQSRSTRAQTPLNTSLSHRIGYDLQIPSPVRALQTSGFLRPSISTYSIVSLPISSLFNNNNVRNFHASARLDFQCMGCKRQFTHKHARRQHWAHFKNCHKRHEMHRLWLNKTAHDYILEMKKVSDQNKQRWAQIMKERAERKKMIIQEEEEAWKKALEEENRQIEASQKARSGQ